MRSPLPGSASAALAGVRTDDHAGLRFARHVKRLGNVRAAGEFDSLGADGAVDVDLGKRGGSAEADVAVGRYPNAAGGVRVWGDYESPTPDGRLVGKSNQAPAAIIHQALTEVLVRQRPRRTGKDCAETRRIAGAENRPSDRVQFP